MTKATYDYLMSLLAVIHKDGGHFATKHGLAKASADAQEIVIADRIAIAELERVNAEYANWMHALTVELVEAGMQGGDREVTLANVRALIKERAEARDALELAVGSPLPAATFKTIRKVLARAQRASRQPPVADSAAS
jgi:hypothetical protein